MSTTAGAPAASGAQDGPASTRTEPTRTDPTRIEQKARALGVTSATGLVIGSIIHLHLHQVHPTRKPAHIHPHTATRFLILENSLS